MLSDDVINTIIITAGSIAGAIIAAIGAKQGIEYRKRRRKREVALDESEAVDRYTADPGQFVRDVLESNRQLTNEVRGYRDEVSALRVELAEVRGESRKRTTAMTRWAGRIMLAWGVEKEMPYPEGEDALTLADIIPSALEATQPRRTPRPNI